MDQPLFALARCDIARVALPLPVDELFEYAVPAELDEHAQPGCRVRVRLRDRGLTGVIVERTAHPRFQGRLLPIESVVDLEPALSSAMLEMLREAAIEVVCPFGIALATALPAGSAPRTAAGYAITANGRAALAAGAIASSDRSLLEALDRQPRTRSYLRKFGGAKRLDAFERDRLVVKTSLLRPAAARIATIRTARLAAGVDTEQATATLLARAPQQAALLRRIAAEPESPTRSLLDAFPDAARLLRRLAERDLVELTEQRVSRDVLGEPLEADCRVSLTPDQSTCLEPIVDAIGQSRCETFLLHGVTGSGKTEIYLRAVGEALRAGRQALVLVPEITLTHQILARLRGRFGDELAVLHSGLRPGERLEQWELLRAGATPIAVGARSALFAPLENLGVIVIDEEHDSAYKNDEGFRYHARELARRRGEQVGCPIILGSATPSLDTRFAAESGDVRRLVLAKRIGERPLPAVEIVDLVKERDRSPRGRKVILSTPLRRAIAETLADGGQSILFLNRRGFSTAILCFECGATEHCKNCDIALVYHASEQCLRCHYCDFEIPPPDRCSECGAPDAALMGVGTQRLEEEVRSQFPSARIARLDRDTAKKRGFTESVVRSLHDRSIDIVVGTQMVAKGHDFPGVRLVGVVVADVGLHLPDFRAAERTFQLLTQVAGRAGRDAAPGRVVIQTFAPSHYAIQPVLNHDYERFYTEELGHRKALGYPPFGRLIRVLITGPDEAETRSAALELSRLVSAIAVDGSKQELEVLGPAPAPLARLRGRYRYQLLVKGPPGPLLRGAAETLVKSTAGLSAPLQASVDVNPVSML
jgi:primosomal protein N' (replication factor Y)